MLQGIGRLSSGGFLVKFNAARHWSPSGGFLVNFDAARHWSPSGGFIVNINAARHWSPSGGFLVNIDAARQEKFLSDSLLETMVLLCLAYGCRYTTCIFVTDDHALLVHCMILLVCLSSLS